MTSREEKLAAARKKLREFQGKSRENESSSKESLQSNGLAANSSSPVKFYQDTVRSDSPADLARLAWERRQTLEINEIQQLEHLNLQHNQSETIIECLPDEAERERAYQLEMSQLHEQLQRQGQAINVLISERTEAQTALSKVQAELQQKSDSLEDLKSKYLESSRRLHDFENAPPRQMSSITPTTQAEEELRETLNDSTRKISMLEDQVGELRSRLEGKNAECTNLVTHVQSLQNSLSVAHVRIQQLTTDESPKTNIQDKNFEEENQSLRKQVELLERRLQAAAMEGEQAAHRFQVYADQCESQLTSLRSQLKELLDQNNALKQQNITIMQQRDALEIKMKMEKTQGVPLESRIDELNKENASLALRLQEKDSEVNGLQTRLTENEEQLSKILLDLQSSQDKVRWFEARAGNSHPDPALLAAMESDKVAASRAVAQNQKMKEQLTELEGAFVRLSDEKLTLTEKLSQAEHQNTELRNSAAKQDHSHSHDHDHDDHDHDHCDHDTDPEEAEWDEEMLRRVVATLRRDKTELVKRLQHYQGNASFQVEIHSHDDDHHHHHHHEGEECSSEKHASDGEVAELRRAVEQLQQDKAELLKRLGGPTEDPEVQGLLETKLRRTMDDIASLDEEKQRLEHLVLQLQGETETIGEYIALYHKQRLLLRQRSVEKDEQLVQLSRDREELKEKLLSLNELVGKMVGVDAESENGGAKEKIEEMTAQKIRALITEIGNNNVVNAHSVAFEHCSCCSGRLITV